MLWLFPAHSASSAGTGRQARRRSLASVLRVAVAVCSPVVAQAGCVDFDLEERIEDTRILGMRTEPAEILYSPLFLTPPTERPPILPLPTIDVDLEVFAFDPRGGVVSTTIGLCPEGRGDASCRVYDPTAELDALDPAVRDEVAALLVPATIDGVSEVEASPAGRIAPNRFSYRITPAVIDFLQPKDANGRPVPSLFSLLPRFAVAVENSTARDAGADVFAERGFKRLPLTLDLTSEQLPPDFRIDLARAIGVELCDGPIPDDSSFSEGLATCLHPRSPNVNPALLGFRLEVARSVNELTQGTLEGDAPDLGLRSLLRANPGDVVALTPMFAPGAVERYQVLSFDIEASRITILNRVEDLACNWYSTRGPTSNTLTSLQFTRERLGVLWQLPADAVSGERDSLVLVVLDQRGGTAVAEVTVTYR